MTRLIYSRYWTPIANLLVGVIMLAYVGSILLTAQQLESLADPLVRYAVAFVIVQFTVLLALIVLLTIGKSLRSRWEMRRAARTRTLEELLAAPDCEAATLDAARKWPDEFLTVVYYAMQAVRGSERDRVIGLLKASALYPKLLRETVSQNPNRAIRAITLLGQLEAQEARAAVSRALEHPAETIRQAARKAILQGHDEAAQRRLLDGLPQLPPWQRLLVFHFAPADSDLLPEFIIEALQSGDESRVLIALEFTLTRQRVVPCSVSSDLARSKNSEIRIKFFKALRFFRVEGSMIEVLQTGLCDPDWRVRAMAAQACGHARAAVLAGRLLEMCQKFDNPAEAAHAARALSALGGEGWLRLQQVANSQTDVARQIATEAVERHMLGGVA